MTRGERNVALRIRREERPPVFRELGDARSGAFTVSKIADIRVTQGELTEALRLCRSRRVFFFLRRNNESYASEPA